MLVATGTEPVHCRIGSLEMNDAVYLFTCMCSLPYRQLRNANLCGEWDAASSLPYRQLRNNWRTNGGVVEGSLPYRQLRKYQSLYLLLSYQFTAV